MNDDARHSLAQKQALRLRRFLLGTTTYVLGLSVLGLCTALGLLPVERLAVIAGTFLLINAGLFAVFRLGWNLHFRDPSLTLFQVLTGVAANAFVLSMGNQIQFLAVPFFSSMFVFAMLRLTPTEVMWVAFGVLVAYCAALGLRIDDPGGPVDARLDLVNFALVVISAIWYGAAASYISNLRARLRASVETIEQLAIRDGLTGAWNRRHIDALFSDELQRQVRFGGRLSAALLDLDHFKNINDLHGHPAGDAVIRAVAAGLQRELRAIDHLGRFGGEEFLAVLPGTGLEDARLCAERLRAAVAALNVLPDPKLRVTISIGIAESAAGESPADFLSRIDRALYRAKHNGRNRVEADEAAVSRPPLQPA
jgi:diguanylate cyclase (GGDEF)-like protein